MAFTGVDSLDRSIAKANAWMADIDKVGTDLVPVHDQFPEAIPVDMHA